MHNYYVLNNGRLSRESNTLSVVSTDGKKKPIPIEDVESLYLYGEVDINTKLLIFLAQKKVTLHVFNYYGFYSGSYYPREYLHSGYLLVHQVQHYTDAAKRMHLAREFVRASAHSILRNVAYYSRRRGSSAADSDPTGEIGDPPLTSSAIPTDEQFETDLDTAALSPQSLTEVAPISGKNGSPSLSTTDPDSGQWPSNLAGKAVPSPSAPDVSLAFPELEERDPLLVELDYSEPAEPLDALRQTIAELARLIEHVSEVNPLRGVEGKIRERYYQSWRHILSDEWAFTQRVRRPPDNEVNALISFGNSHLYTVCLSEIYRTQLTPTISYLHEPGARRFSLALDISEIFKPLIVDRAIFRLINTGQLKPSHFERAMGGCYLNETGKKLFITAMEDRLKTTIKHRRLNRHVSYRHLIRLECYKLVRHLTGDEEYKAFRAWW